MVRHLQSGRMNALCVGTRQPVAEVLESSVLLRTLCVPWHSPYVERPIGSIRRECLDHVVVATETSLRLHIPSYLDYHHAACCHLSLGNDSTDRRAVEPPELGKIVAVPIVDRLQHRYGRRAA